LIRVPSAKTEGRLENGPPFFCALTSPSGLTQIAAAALRVKIRIVPITDYPKWARICRTEAVATNEPATRAFLIELAQEYEAMARREQDDSRLGKVPVMPSAFHSSATAA